MTQKFQVGDLVVEGTIVAVYDALFWRRRLVTYDPAPWDSKWLGWDDPGRCVYTIALDKPCRQMSLEEYNEQYRQYYDGKRQIDEEHINQSYYSNVPMLFHLTVPEDAIKLATNVRRTDEELDRMVEFCKENP